MDERPFLTRGTSPSHKLVEIVLKSSNQGGGGDLSTFGPQTWREGDVAANDAIYAFTF